jgi:hypothetical protein
MNRTKHNNYEQGRYIDFCQGIVNNEFKPGKLDTSDPFTSPRTPKLDYSDSDQLRARGTRTS